MLSGAVWERRGEVLLLVYGVVGEHGWLTALLPLHWSPGLLQTITSYSRDTNPVGWGTAVKQLWLEAPPPAWGETFLELCWNPRLPCNSKSFPVSFHRYWAWVGLWRLSLSTPAFFPLSFTNTSPKKSLAHLIHQLLRSPSLHTKKHTNLPS